ncbi:hypothetical protein FJTKL_00072 [Diaporthe vaccinii]|uniref:Uncharacterized protein n=1 Tax=Diaporthe vaccinii TaxID=105482 RepID=A0ABR4E4L3_9PEZI
MHPWVYPLAHRFGRLRDEGLFTDYKMFKSHQDTWRKLYAAHDRETSHLMRPFGPDWGAPWFTSGSRGVRGERQLTDLEVVLVRQGVAGEVCLGHRLQDLLAHLVHGVLHAGALVLGKRLHGDGPGGLPGGVEPGRGLAHGVDPGEGLPRPGAVDVGRQDAVPGLGEGGVLVAHEAVELGPGALEHREPHDAAPERDAAVPGHGGLDVAGLLAVAVEGVRVGLAVDDHAGPAVHDDLDVGGGDVRVGVQEVLTQDRGEELGRVDGVFLCLDVDGVLHRVRGHDDAVVGLCVPGPGHLLRCLDLPFKQAGHCHLCDGLDPGGLVPVHLVDADIVLPIPGRCESGHSENQVRCNARHAMNSCMLSTLPDRLCHGHEKDGRSEGLPVWYTHTSLRTMLF